jgi:hypothetical protein
MCDRLSGPWIRGGGRKERAAKRRAKKKEGLQSAQDEDGLGSALEGSSLRADREDDIQMDEEVEFPSGEEDDLKNPRIDSLQTTPAAKSCTKPHQLTPTAPPFVPSS